MKHYYLDNQKFGSENWFTYMDIYSEVVKEFPSGSKFVEVGSWKGRSSAYMAVEIANSNKDIDFYCVDTWNGSEEHQNKEYDLKNLYSIFLNNMEPVEEYYTPLRMTSLEAANKFKDETLDFILIDASHDYENVKKDIIAWLPKLKKGGIIAGDDFGDFPGVRKAVNELFSGKFTQRNKCWYLRKEKSELVVKFSSQSQNTLWIVDNFYENPDEIRKFAIEQDYHIGGIGRGYIGNRTFKQFLFPGIKERFEEIMGKKITKFEEHGMNGRFQYCWAGQPRVYHTDFQNWGGMIYLTPDAPYEAGTALYANKANRARSFRDNGYSSFWAQTETHLDPTGFEPVDVAGNVYNRLVIFDAACIHSAMEYFHKEDPSKCRLWQMFFFDTE